MSGPASTHDEGAVGDEEVLYRRIHQKQLVRDEDRGEWRVSSGDWDDPGDEVSVYTATALTQLAMEPIETLDGLPTHSLATITCGAARKLGFALVIQPDLEDKHRRGEAHAVLVGMSPGKAGRRQRKQLAEASTLVVLRPPQKAT